MGCDIHLYVEEFKTVNGKKQWVCIDNWELNPYYGDDEPRYNHRSFYHGRDYELFQSLAGVRGDEIEPASEIRGLPVDVSEAVKNESGEWGEDGHSHSWLTLSEIYTHATKIGGTIKRSGMVSQEQANQWNSERIAPKSWCRSTSDKSAIYLEWTDKYNPLKRLIKQIEKGVKVFLYSYEMKYMKENKNNYRIVFWFDN